MAFLLGSTRIYTLLLATIAAAGMALATTLICCVVKAHLQGARRRRRAARYMNGTSVGVTTRNRRWYGGSRPPRRGMNISALHATDTSVQQMLSWEELVHIIVQSDAAAITSLRLSTTGSENAHTNVATGSRRASNADDTVSQQRRHSQSAADFERQVLQRSCKLGSSSAQVELEAPVRDGTLYYGCLDAHLSKMLAHIGGEEALVAAERLPSAALLFGPGSFLHVAAHEMDRVDIQSASELAKRLQMTAVAVCALRMASLAEVGVNPALAATPAPWTSDFMDLRLKLGKVQAAEEATVSSSQAGEVSVDVGEDSGDELEQCGSTSEVVAGAAADDKDGCEAVVAEAASEATASPAGGEAQSKERTASQPYLKEVTNSLRKTLSRGIRGKGREGGGGKQGWPLQAREGSTLGKSSLAELRPSGAPAPLTLRTGTEVGCVQLGLLCGNKVAVHEFIPSVKRQLMRLCSLLKEHPHPSVITPIAICVAPGREAVVVPAVRLCYLEDALSGGAPSSPAGNAEGGAPCAGSGLPWRARLVIAYDVVMGVHHLHSRFSEPLVHGSIHPATIGLSHGYHACLVDPGFLPASLSVADKGIETAGPTQLRGPDPQDREMGPMVSDTAYLDPQYHKRGQFTPPADIYALGVVLLKLLTALPAKGIVTVVKEAYRQEMLEDVLDPSAGDWPPNVAQGLVELALSCCERRHTRRSKLEPEALYQLQGLLLDTFRLLLAERFVTPPAAAAQPTQPEEQQRRSSGAREAQ